MDKNYEIININFTSKFGEIDIIAIKDDILIFIEVKGRKNIFFYEPREAVTKAKQKKIIRTARFFLLKNKYNDMQIRFDVIEIITDTKTINYIENAFWEE